MPCGWRRRGVFTVSSFAVVSGCSEASSFARVVPESMTFGCVGPGLTSLTSISALLVSPGRLCSSPSSAPLTPTDGYFVFTSRSAPARLPADGELPFLELGHQQAHGTQMDLCQRAVRHGVGEQVAHSFDEVDVLLACGELHGIALGTERRGLRCI
ncbi:MAG TPA: hypothetical protein VIM73_04530 [Polyangiaceae bacterium]